ncbi:MAG: hypothetical protein ABI647_06205 [Gemmatimonadota bacterium]
MIARARAWLAAFIALFGARPLAAQLPRRELGPVAMVVASEPVFAGLGVSGAFRLANEVRAVGTATMGGAGSHVVARGDAELQVVLDPFGKGKARLFAGAGLSGVTGPDGGGFLLVSAGLETAPRARRGWSVELGIAGGARLAIAYRFRSGSKSRR